MCGICGVASSDPRSKPVSSGALTRMTDVIEHRGPDDDGHHLAEGVGLGMRRLSVIDPEHSPQPVRNETGTVVTVFNGEIFNFRDLRRDLIARGHTFATGGDTETIVHLYEEHGPRFVERLRGMFGVAVWDAERARLVIARDRMGVKPLYIAEGRWGIAFASEIKSLIAGGMVVPELDPEGAELFLAHGFVPGPRTLFRGVRKLPPATSVVFEDGRLVEERTYWTPYDDESVRASGTWAEDQERLTELLREAVRARMVSDVPLGVMLSGGLDSSLITALMAESTSHPVKTYSIGFEEDGAANELDDARRVADRLGTDHHELMTSAVDHPGLLDEALWHMEEPVADLSGLGFMLLSRLARDSVTVALSGQGADELLGGYLKHQVAAGAQAVARGPACLRRAVRLAARAAPAGSTSGRGLAAIGADDPVDRLLAMSRVVQAHERAETLDPSFLLPDGERLIDESVRCHLPQREMSILGETLHLDRNLALVDNMLLYFDKMSMATSLEVRVPFMDHDVVSFCVALPDDRKVWRNRRKEILKRASRGLVEDAIIDKRKRGFFHAALGTWMRVHRETLFENVLLDERTRNRGIFRPETVASLVAAAGEDGKKASQRLFCLLLLEQWHRLFVDPGSPGHALASQAEFASAA